MEENELIDPLSLFGQETYEEAYAKNVEESRSFQKIQHFRIDSAGTYTVRILPIAPDKQPDGTYIVTKKGYEYAIKTQVLKLDRPNAKSKKDAVTYVNVCHSSCANISVDLIDTYLQIAEDKYGDDEALIKKLRSNSFDGGLKWNSQRCMYIYDMKKRAEGLQLLTLSYSQYKDLEERKLAVWKKLLDKKAGALCPISSPQNAYPVEIIRKEENKKTTYSFNIDTLSGEDQLSTEELTALLNAPRLPEVIYRYSRYHLEATIEFLKQYDAKMELDIMNSKEIDTTIKQISMELPSDDKSHFSFDKKNAENNDNSDSGIDALWDKYDELVERKLGDKSDEGQELRDAIRNFIDENDLSVKVTRTKTNKDLLEAIEDALENAKDNTPDEEEEGDEEEENGSSKEQGDEHEDEGESDDEKEEDEEEERRDRRSRRSARPVRPRN